MVNSLGYMYGAIHTSKWVFPQFKCDTLSLLTWNHFDFAQGGFSSFAEKYDTYLHKFVHLFPPPAPS